MEKAAVPRGPKLLPGLKSHASEVQTTCGQQGISKDFQMGQEQVFPAQSLGPEKPLALHFCIRMCHCS